MDKITPERQLTILGHLDEMSKKLNTFHQCTVYDDFLEDLKYVKELVKRDIRQPIRYEQDGAYSIRKCPKCSTTLDDTRCPNYCKFCGQKLRR